MKLIATILTAGLVLSASSAAMAGGIYNEHTVRNTKGDTRAVIKSQTTVDGVKSVREALTKVDAVGENAGAQLRFNGAHVSGSAFANNIENPDPFVVFGRTDMNSRETYSSNTDATVYDNSWYKETSTRYELGTSY